MPWRTIWHCVFISVSIGLLGPSLTNLRMASKFSGHGDSERFPLELETDDKTETNAKKIDRKSDI